MNISHLKTLFLQEYEMNQSAKELFEWMEKQMEPEPQSKNDVPYWVIEIQNEKGTNYYNVMDGNWHNKIHNATKFNSREKALDIDLDFRQTGCYLTEHIDISEPMRESDIVSKVPIGKSLGKFKLEPMKEGKEVKTAEEILKNHGMYISDYALQDLKQSDPSNIQYKQILDAMQEYRNQAIVLPEKYDYSLPSLRDIGYNEAIDDIKILNGIK